MRVRGIDTSLINPEKHEHPRRYRRAVAYLAGGIFLGIAMTVVGIYAVQQRVTGANIYVATLALVGPCLIFLSAVGFSTYLEQLETKSYGAMYDQAREPPASETNPAAPPSH